MKYTYDEFVKASGYYSNQVQYTCHYHLEKMPFKPYKKDDLIFSTYVNTGGLSGASCWTDEPPSPYKSYEKQDFSELKDYLKKLDIKLDNSQFHNLISKFHVGEYSEYDYYGNSDDYEISYLSIREIYDYLNSILNKDYKSEIDNEYYYDDGKYSIVLKCGYQIITDSKIEAHQELKELFKFYYMQQEYKLENY